MVLRLCSHIRALLLCWSWQAKPQPCLISAEKDNELYSPSERSSPPDDLGKREPSVSSLFMSKGRLKVTVNWLSRRKLDSPKWELHREVFHLLVKEFGLPARALFASHLNHKVYVFSCWQHHKAKATDVLSQRLAKQTLTCLSSPSPECYRRSVKKLKLW